MFNRREAGINFSQIKYKLLNNSTFIPHIRSDGTSSIPYTILDRFIYELPAVALLKIYTERNFNLRIKKLHLVGNSFIISLKAERNFKNIKIQVLNIKSKKKLLDRKNVDFVKYIPKFTSKKTPIYIFDDDSSYVIGGHYKKDILVKKEILQDKNIPLVLGLYLTEGGKIDATFTNSWPEAINVVLNFVERNFSIPRKKVLVSICCNPNLKSKKSELEHFWTEKTGITNFFKNLHFNKNVRSPQGILELYFSSKIIKEIFVNLCYKLDLDKNFKFIDGFLSGDGSPILQNKACITHHILFDSKAKNYDKYKRIFEGYKFGLINKNRFVIYTNWEQNLELLMNGAYLHSPMKRFRFLKYFLSLPKTKIVNNKDVIKLRNEFIKQKHYLEEFYKSLAIKYNIYSINRMGEYIKWNL